jgi:hypothetical protein
MASILVAENSKVTVDMLSECIQACQACNYRCCEGSTQMGECGRLCVDCAAICELTLTLLSRGSRWSARIAELCAEACDSCAAECSKFDDEYCQQCARSCRACAEQCREMAT